MPLFPPFIGGSYTAQSAVAAGEQTVNLFLERITTPGATVPWALFPTPGARTISNFGNRGRGRALSYQNGRVFAVVEDEFYEYVVSTGDILFRGTVATDVDASPARITSNGLGANQIFVTASGVGYLYDMTANTFSTVFAGGAHQCGMLDGFIWVLNRDDSSLWSSAALDASVFPGFQYRDMAPDPWRSALAMRRQILLCGEHTSEVWYNAGTAPFPFAPHPSGGFGIGIAAVDSLCRVGDGAMWLSQTEDGIGDVVLLEGTAPRVVSTHALRTAIEGYSRVDDAIGDCYEENGHTFYLLKFPSANTTWCFDLSTGSWHERGTWDSVSGTYQAWAPTWHIYASRKHLWLDRITGHLLESSLSNYTDVNGATIRRVRRGPHLFNDHRRITFSKFELLMQPGVGLSGTVPTVGVDPQVQLRYSDDWGNTWHDAGNRSIGKQGEYGVVATWNRLGSAFQRQYEVVMTDPVAFQLMGAVIDAKPSSGGAR